MDQELWPIAERRIQEILWAIQPNVASEWRRRELTDYIQMVIKGCFGTEVLSFGSVPLKAYLPDGDIDLTVLCRQNEEEDLARAICCILDRKPNESGFQVQDVHYVCAKVKIIKCIVNNIAIDISFNQMAGLCTLCFLEQVDKVIGKDHLFKKSIILIKAWCYYESRILGAIHGLISTYGLETMVLCIINLFHSTLRGPLQVLYRFLEYYSKFDWDRYCVTINGPLSLSSLPKISETPDNEGEKLLLSKEFLEHCRGAFSDPRRMHEGKLQEFPVKYLNIVDPLKDHNNLGRCINRGNAFRIQSAFSLGFKHLRKKLALPCDCIGQGLEKFFESTLNRNGRGQRPDLQSPVPSFGSGRYLQSNLSGDYDFYFGGMLYGQVLECPVYSHPMPPPLQVRRRNTTLHANDWNVVNQMSMNVLALPFYHRSASQQIANMCGLRSIPGTGTFIPDGTPTHHKYVPRQKQKTECRPRPVMTNPPQKGNQVEVLSKTNTGGHAGSLGLTHEEFLHLPGTPPSKDNAPSNQWASLQPKKISHPIEDRKLGILGPAPFPLGMPLLEARSDTCISYSGDPKTSVPVMSLPNQLPITREVNDETFQLDNMNFQPSGKLTILETESSDLVTHQ